MIPIGAPVTCTVADRIVHETVHGYVNGPYPYIVIDHYSRLLGYKESEVRIRYDKPAMFTLWQLNVAVCGNTNEEWYNSHPYYDNYEALLDPNTAKRYIDELSS